MKSLARISGPIAALSLILTALSGGPAAANLLSPTDEGLYRQALAAAKEEKFDYARGLASRADQKLLGKVVRWLELTQARSGATFAEITAFMRENPDWPQISVLQRRAEEAITAATPDQTVLEWFAKNPPVTVDGQTAYGQALLAAGQTEKAVEQLRTAWIEGNFGTLQEKQFLGLFGQYLRDKDHVARLDRLLWDRYEQAAKAQAARADADHRLLAQARLALIENKGGEEKAIAKVPAKLQGDPGLVYERLRWRRAKDMDAEAMQLLKHPSRNKVRPDLWWNERSVLARRALQTGAISQAYDIAHDHGQTEGSGYADAEWMAGWIALRFLDDRKVALTHFRRMLEKVATPVSKARGNYWAGRAAEAMGDKEASAEHYRQAARFVTSFYGQLAAARLNEGQQWPLPADPLPTAEDIEVVENHELTKVARMLAEVGAFDQMRPFVLRLSDIAKSPGQRTLAASLAAGLGRPDIAVSVARRSDRDGVPLIASGFPVPEIDYENGPEKSLVFALIRQESGFHFEAVSSVGARGLMQLMPATAKQLAQKANVAFSPDRLTADPSFNVRLGSRYLGNLLDDYNGSYILSLAAYNAGPGRVRKWLRENGDPRTADVDAIDWIEMIPFTETRNYVQRVLESVQVYRRRLGATDLALSLEGDLKRGT